MLNFFNDNGVVIEKIWDDWEKKKNYNPFLKKVLRGRMCVNYSRFDEFSFLLHYNISNTILDMSIYDLWLLTCDSKLELTKILCNLKLLVMLIIK
jgi:hypothetical protein